MGDGPRVRSPLVEGLAVLGQRAFTGAIRELTITEELLLRRIFQDSVDYDQIRIATTNLGAKDRPYTFANTIRVPQGTDFTTRILVHEVTHVWQYQTKGSGYISDSAWHQLTDQSAYCVRLVPNQPLSSYTAEQQAVIVESYYADQQSNPKAPATDTTYDPSKTASPPLGWSRLPDVMRMIAEVQRARPISEQTRLEDRLFGPGGPPQETPGAPKMDPVVPLLRVEF